MKYLVAYDIGEEKRLRRIARVCEDYGYRLQKSLFECELTDVLFQALWTELRNMINPDEDAILAWPLCGSCQGRAITDGKSPSDKRVEELALVC